MGEGHDNQRYPLLSILVHGVLMSLALAVYENSTREVCHTWLNKLASTEGTSINTSLFSLLITFDHMGKIGFSHEFGTIEAGKENKMLDLLEVMFGQFGRLGELVWPVALMQSLGVGGDAAEFDELTREMADRRTKVSFFFFLLLSCVGQGFCCVRPEAC